MILLDQILEHDAVSQSGKKPSKIEAFDAALVLANTIDCADWETGKYEAMVAILRYLAPNIRKLKTTGLPLLAKVINPTSPRELENYIFIRDNKGYAMGGPRLIIQEDLDKPDGAYSPKTGLLVPNVTIDGCIDSVTKSMDAVWREPCYKNPVTFHGIDPLKITTIDDENGQSATLDTIPVDIKHLDIIPDGSLISGNKDFGCICFEHDEHKIRGIIMGLQKRGAR